jgi:hypothetical protein
MEIAEGKVVRLDGLPCSDEVPSRFAQLENPIKKWDYYPFGRQHTPSAWNFRAVGVISSTM